MKKIIIVDRARRVAMVEPGVTFGELIPAAEKEGLRLNMPLLPRKSKSVVGSMLEREPVIMPKYQWDISDPWLVPRYSLEPVMSLEPGRRPGRVRRGAVGSRGRAKSALWARYGFLAQAYPGSAGDHGHRHLGIHAM